jgi:SulP family sulfate permease
MRAGAQGWTERLRELAIDLPPDAGAAVAVLALSIPQGLAYATIAGLPPVMGLYAAAIPAIVGSLIHSSRHIVIGPTNALSLLVGGAVLAVSSRSPIEVALALALGVAVFQLVATALRLSAVVDYVSSPTVIGYVTGAGVLIAAGQLHNLTSTSGPRGSLWTTVSGWVEALPDAHGPALLVGGVTVVIIVLLRALGRKLGRRPPAAMVVIALGLGADLLFDLEAKGLRVLSDLSPIPVGLPPLTVPSLSLAIELAPFALACTMLSLVESNAISRAIAARTGQQQLDSKRDFLGLGLANLGAALFGAYPVSGSLVRSALNERSGAKTRASGVLAGVVMLAVLLSFAPLFDHIPLSCIAGVLMIVAWDLIDFERIRMVLRTSWGDRLTFIVTMVGTWVLALDEAIYLGVGLSVVWFLRKASLLTIRELVMTPAGLLQEQALDVSLGDNTRCSAIRLIQVEGALFFGSAGELRSALDKVSLEPGVKVLIVRVKRAKGLDMTVAEALAWLCAGMRERKQHLLLAGMTPDMMRVLERSGAAAVIGAEQLFATQTRWFAALEAAKQRALVLVGDEHVEDCGLERARPF